MFTDYNDVLRFHTRPISPDRRQAPRDGEIRLRVKRLIRVYL